MAVVDPYVSLRDWDSSLYRADSAAVDRFLDAIDATLSPGWVRDRQYEQTRPQRDRIRCYLFDRAGDPAVRVWLERVTATRVRGGPIEVLRYPPSGDGVQIARLVSEIADGCVLPAAKAVGVRCSRPAFGPRSSVTRVAETLLTQFADAADGEWPLKERLLGLWEELIFVCLSEHVGIDRAELARWLEDSGWEHELVPGLVDRFFADSEWLADRLAAWAP